MCGSDFRHDNKICLNIDHHISVGWRLPIHLNCLKFASPKLAKSTALESLHVKWPIIIIGVKLRVLFWAHKILLFYDKYFNDYLINEVVEVIVAPLLSLSHKTTLYNIRMLSIHSILLYINAINDLMHIFNFRWVQPFDWVRKTFIEKPAPEEN